MSSLLRRITQRGGQHSSSVRQTRNSAETSEQQPPAHAPETSEQQRPAPATKILTLKRTCEDKPPGIARANSLGVSTESSLPLRSPQSPQAPLSPSSSQSSSPRTPRWARLLGPVAASMTSALVSQAHRVCDSTRFIRVDYTIGKQLGAGRFASVREGVSRQSGEHVAIKTLHRHDNWFNLEAVREEIVLMQSLRGQQHCIDLFDVYEDWESVYLVQQLAPGGHLAARIKMVKGQFQEDEAAVLVAQVLEALDALHSRGIAHRDVKFENLLLMSKDPQSEEYNRVKLCDFGLCKALDDTGSITTISGTKLFFAPEIVQSLHTAKPGAALPHHEVRYDLKVDIWALGVVCYTLLYGEEPFKNESDSIMFPKIRRGANIPTTASHGAQDMVSCLLCLDPKQRPSAQQALQHPWITETLHRQMPKLAACRRGSHADVTESMLSTSWTVAHCSEHHAHLIPPLLS